MALNFMTSEALRNSLLTQAKTDLDGGFLEMYGGSIPDIDADITGRSGDLIVTLSESDDGVTGLTFEAPAAGIMLKATAETWLGTNAQTLAPTWYRMAGPNDDKGLGSVTTNKRVQGTVGVLNCDLLVANATLTSGQEQRIDYYAIGLPNS